SGLCMAAAAGMAMSLLVQFLVVNCFLACSDCDGQLPVGLGFVAMDQFIIVEALWMKYSNSVSAKVLECPGLRGATVSPIGSAFHHSCRSGAIHLGRGSTVELAKWKRRRVCRRSWLINVKRIMGEDTDGVAGAQEGGGDNDESSSGSEAETIIVAPKGTNGLGEGGGATRTRESFVAKAEQTFEMVSVPPDRWMGTPSWDERVCGWDSQLGKNDMGELAFGGKQPKGKEVRTFEEWTRAVAAWGLECLHALATFVYVPLPKNYLLALMVLDFKVISRMMFLTSPQLTVQLLFLSQRHTSSLPLIRAVVAVIVMIGIARGFICSRARFGDVVVLRRGGVLMALAVAIGMMRAQGVTECEVIDKKKFYASKRCAETEFRDGPKGVKYREVKIGEGKTATKGSLCTVHYEGKSLSGSRMECTFKNSLTGIRFYCGSPQPTVAAFLNEGVVGMREGGHREMIVPPHMHYPERWPNRILIYEVSLMRVRGGEGNEEADAVEKEEFDNMPWLAKVLYRLMPY
ncbi:hypothetical protein FOZ63_013059, partial [Perkinsus olseni]